MDNVAVMDRVLNIIDVGAVLQPQHPRCRRRIFRQRIDPFDDCTDEEFIERFRLSKDCVTNLLNELRRHLPTSINRRGKSIYTNQYVYVIQNL